MQLEQPDRGEILFHGKNLAEMTAKEKWLNRQKMQMVFQDPLASFIPNEKSLTFSPSRWKIIRD